jgi:Lon protease-like protein
MSDDSLAPDRFDGTVRLFPLPNVVLFPHAIQALHIFEPRYRRMTADALAGDRLIAPALLRPGWETDYERRPAVHPVVCVGRITADQKLDDGRYHLLLRGVARATILEEIEDDRPYRSARVELLSDVPPPEAMTKRLRSEVGRMVLPWFQQHPTALEQLRQLLASDATLAVVGDLLGFAVPLPLETKQRLLSEPSVARRAELLIEALRVNLPEQPDAARKFPPGFSSN